MIKTVTLNAAVDKTYYLDAFLPESVNRAAEVYAVPGGKGLNAARVVHALGGRTQATGIVGGSNGQFIRTGLDAAGIAHDFAETEGESRLCLNFISRETNASTEVLEPGPTIGEAELAQVALKVTDGLTDSDIVILSGSLPKGAPAETYGKLIALIRQSGARAFLDTSGAALVHGLEATPFFIKPNKDEAEALLGISVRDEHEVAATVRHWMAAGIACPIVTLGASGSIAGFGGTCYRVHAPRIEAVNTVGCGDSFVAGMAVAMRGGMPIREALRFATAVGAANALTRHAGEVYESDVLRLTEQVEVTELS
ncbi:1-phosphofructokinase family hexose kinase [Paenibacillus beijingensis]|uniref:Tagatose-6-phosphate kinase n=1 Tax=Paenibacillus beijingensis TaxID=1126833 RepID=A0A0D5NKJ8_9BACL|nr:1-phosphofructokinase family hexose kinase [Paenibacillus beijingensis]AJY75635.1 1-phosphofructokinase [Paenibacillus beijingensis]